MKLLDEGNKAKPTILIVAGHYLPGSKSGGPTRSIANLADALGDDFHLRILTRDRDLGDTEPYRGVQRNRWQSLEKTEVMYVSPQRGNLFSWHNLLVKSSADVVYLNSFFDTLTIRTLFLRGAGLLRDIPVIVAPRGEFSSGALGLKRWKKKLYLHSGRALRLFKDIIWQATSTSEQADIVAQFENDLDSGRSQLVVAGDIPVPDSHAVAQREVKSAGNARIVFISRVARMKNLQYVLRLLKDIPGHIIFDIYGPIEDKIYWRKCEEEIAKLPPNIQAVYRGHLTTPIVMEVLSAAHLMFLPTLGENYGHAIVEALVCGCPVLISDRTPWRNLEAHCAGWDISLAHPEQFKAALAKLVSMDQSEFNVWSAGAASYAASRVGRDAAIEASYRMLVHALTHR